MKVVDPWRFSESRPILPFRVSEHGLNNVGFRVRDDLEYSNEKPWTVEMEHHEITDELFSPSFKIELDPQQIGQETEISIDDLALSIVVRDTALWTSKIVDHWELANPPKTFNVPKELLRNLSAARGLRFTAQVCPIHELEPQFRRAHRRGHLLCSRAYEIKAPDDGAGFPIKVVDAAHFEIPETVWEIRWLSESDFDQPVEKILNVLINRDQAEKLLRISSHDSVGGILWTEIAVDVFVEICMVMFAEVTDEPQDPDGLLAKILARLRSSEDVSIDQLNAKAQGYSTGATYFRGRLQRDLQLGDKIKSVRLAGRSA